MKYLNILLIEDNRLYEELLENAVYSGIILSKIPHVNNKKNFSALEKKVCSHYFRL